MKRPVLLEVRLTDNSLLKLGVYGEVMEKDGSLRVVGHAVQHSQMKQWFPGLENTLQLTPAVSRFGGHNIPPDANYPPDAIQCGACGGTGQGQMQGTGGFQNVLDMAEETSGCGVCGAKGWLSAGSPKGRQCESARCRRMLAPNWIPVYCSTECALDDA